MEGEPMLYAIAVSVAGGTISFIGFRVYTKLEYVAKKIDRLGIAIFGDPDDKIPNGLKREVREIGERLDGHIREQRTANAGTAQALGAITEAVHENTAFRQGQQDAARRRSLDGL